MSRVVVVGAGLGGLAAAARLAAGGHEVTVLEQAPDVGGKLAVERWRGYSFDTGPSLLTMPDVLSELFEATGGPPAGLRLERLETACRYTFGDGTVLDLPGRREEIPAALDAALGPGRGAQWADLLARAERMWHVVREPFLSSPITAATLPAMVSSGVGLAEVAPWLSLRAYGAQSLRDPRLVMLLDRYATYTGSDPRRAPSPLVTVPFAEQEYGSWYVPGGLGEIARAVRERAESLGARVHTGVRVARIEQADGRVSGVVTSDGERMPADVVVANADAASVYGMLDGEAPLRTRLATAAARVRVGLATPSLGGFVLLLAFEGLPEELRGVHHRVLFAEDYDGEFDAIFPSLGARAVGARPRPVRRPTVYVTAPDDPAVLPDGVAGAGAWFVLVNAPRHDPARGCDWRAPGLADAYADHVLAVLASRGLDVRPYLVQRLVRTPADLERATLTPGGSIYGTSSNGPLAAFLRPANRGPVEGLHLVGGSAHPGGGLPLVMLSARIVAEMVGSAA
ncbi:phytoene desaturase [Miniimonas arenae]|uniref:Phytoene desaturase n=1 Tax=Miniimonas arenae TaxID=676201 RepID=A0A5C5BET4_9MICO|nr:phytoene desaturase family protein [Miniimonas arenae]TNU75080.1 phytoene desaturase [Miniimonas arenae]